MAFATLDGTASVSADYVSTNGTLSFVPGTTNQTIRVTVVGDVLNEANETFFVNVTNITGATPGDVQGQGTITNDDKMATTGPELSGEFISEPGAVALKPGNWVTAGIGY